jgi:hypothetical protein
MHAVSIGYDWFFHELSERCALNLRVECFAEFSDSADWNETLSRFVSLPSAHSQRTRVEDGLFRAGLGVGLACWRDNCSWTPGIPDTGNCSGRQTVCLSTFNVQKIVFTKTGSGQTV